MTQKLHLLIVDNQPLFRLGLQTLFASHCQISELSSTTQLHTWHLQPPDIIVLSSNIHGFCLPDTVNEWQQTFPNSKFILLLRFEEEVCAKRLLESGAMGCLLKSDTPDQFMQAIQLVAQGGSCLPRSLWQRATQQPPETAALTDKEMIVLRLVMAEKSNPQIASSLHVSERTVGGYLESIYKKLGVQGRVGAIAKGIKLGLLSE
jgi:DNA-binding NarL/FixJ family response regulator